MILCFYLCFVFMALHFNFCVLCLFFVLCCDAPYNFYYVKSTLSVKITYRLKSFVKHVCCAVKFSCIVEGLWRNVRMLPGWNHFAHDEVVRTVVQFNQHISETEKQPAHSCCCGLGVSSFTAHGKHYRMSFSSFLKDRATFWTSARVDMFQLNK